MTAMDQRNNAPVKRSAPMRPRKRALNILETRARNRRVVSYIALIVSFGFLVNALVGENGVLGRMKSSQAFDAAQAKLARVRLENAAMGDESRRLRDDPATIELVARQRLNLIKPGETLIILKEAKPAGGE
jgi:cell division protein FtsB